MRLGRGKVPDPEFLILGQFNADGLHGYLPIPPLSILTCRMQDPTAPELEAVHIQLTIPGRRHTPMRSQH